MGIGFKGFGTGGGLIGLRILPPAAVAEKFPVGWTSATEQDQIFASDAQADDFFGRSAAISDDGNTLIIGADSEDTGGAQAGAAYIYTRSGTTWSEQQKIVSDDIGADDRFGFAVSISGDGDTVLVGAFGEDAGGADFRGSAYVFTRSEGTWTQEDKLIATTPGIEFDNVGISVSLSIDGNTAIIGASGVDTGGDGAGGAYLFTRSGTTWTERQFIQASDKQEGDRFGVSSAMADDGQTAIVGAYFEDTGGIDAGAAYVFTRSGETWTEEDKVQATDKDAGALFGNSVTISSDGDTVVIGAPSEGLSGEGPGAVYVFTRSGTTWTQEQKLQASDAENLAIFGISVGLANDGNTLIVSASLDDASSFGAAYVFTRSGTTWTEQIKLLASDLQSDDHFGSSAAMSGDGLTAVVGAFDEDTEASSAGAAYIFTI